MPVKEYLITPNVILNCSISGKEDDRAYKYYFKQLLKLFASDGVKFYMTEFDFCLAFVIPILCGLNQFKIHHSLYQEIVGKLMFCPVDESIVESASMYKINPTDALRLASAVEFGLDGIITWEPLHFVQPEEYNKSPIKKYAKGDIFVARSIDVESNEEVEIRMFVSSVSAFLNDTEYALEEEDIVRTHQFYLHKIKIDSYIAGYPVQCLVSLQNKQGEINSCRVGYPVQCSVSLQNKQGEIKEYSTHGNGSINTLFKAIQGCVRECTSLPSFDETFYRVPALGSIDGSANVEVCITMGDNLFQGIGRRDDILWASAEAYVNAINRLLLM